MMRQRLQKERIQKDMSYSDVAKAIGLTERAIRYIETGQRNPSWDTACKLEELFKVPAKELLVQEDSTPNTVTA
jgi:putative transcriptional regulator